MIFINAVDHVHHARACLETLGILTDLIAEGAVVGSPYEENGAGNNLSYSAGLSAKWSERLRTLMSLRFATRPAHEWEQLLQKAGVPVTVVRTTLEWLNLPTATAGGNVTELEDMTFGVVKQAGRYVTITGDDLASGPLKSRAAGPIDVVWNSIRAATAVTSMHDKQEKPLSGIRVLDLSNVIAGPAAGRVLAELGASVIRIDSPAPTAGPRMTMWFGIDVNQGKEAVILDLKSKDGRAVFRNLIKDADIVLHNFLDNSAVKLGISDGELRKINPDIISCQVSAWGGPDHGPFKDFPAFDPVLQAATGIMSRYGTPEAPVLHGIASCVDYISGFLAALGMSQALVAKELGRGGSYVRTSLSMGAQLVQFPFAVAASGSKMSEPSTQAALGYGPHYRIYKAQDGWVFLASRSSDLNTIAQRIGAEPTEAGLEKAFANLPAAKLPVLIAGLTASLVPVRRLDELRETCAVAEPAGHDRNPMSLAMRKIDHPSGYQVSLPVPTWYRFEGKVLETLSPSPYPGTHTSKVLREHGVSDADLADLLSQNVAREKWAVLKHYLPH
jgi:crotonobetainyl-CoA:carnitine CoA-transferase CaiB-like acyl-CoA transferase